MATNLAIEDRLLKEALKIGGHKTKKAIVTEALEEYIPKRRQRNLPSLMSKLVLLVTARFAYASLSHHWLKEN